MAIDQPSLPWMESADAKIARAREHASAFTEELHRFYAAVDPQIRLKKRPDGQSVLVFWSTNAYPPPIRLSVLIGDWAFNLRSSLDSIVCGLARRKDPTSRCKNNGFPIFSEAEHYAKAKPGLLKGIPTQAVRAIDTLQPCARLDGAAKMHPLYLLNALCNSDKHSSTLFTMAYAKNARFRIHDLGEVHEVPLPARWELMSPATILLPPIRSAAPRVEAMAHFELCFRDTRGPWQERGAVEVMDACSHYVDRMVVPALAPFFRHAA